MAKEILEISRVELGESLRQLLLSAAHQALRMERPGDAIDYTRAVLAIFADDFRAATLLAQSSLALRLSDAVSDSLSTSDVTVVADLCRELASTSNRVELEHVLDTVAAIVGGEITTWSHFVDSAGGTLEPVLSTVLPASGHGPMSADANNPIAAAFRDGLVHRSATGTRLHFISVPLIDDRSPRPFGVVSLSLTRDKVSEMTIAVAGILIAQLTRVIPAILGKE